MEDWLQQLGLLGSDAATELKEDIESRQPRPDKGALIFFATKDKTAESCHKAALSTRSFDPLLHTFALPSIESNKFL